MGAVNGDIVGGGLRCKQNHDLGKGFKLVETLWLFLGLVLLGRFIGKLGKVF